VQKIIKKKMKKIEIEDKSKMTLKEFINSNWGGIIL